MTVGIYPKKPGETVFYSPYRKHKFSLPKLDPKTKQPIQCTNPVTGVGLFDPYGAPVYQEESFDFTPWKQRFTEDGYYCVFVCDANTPKRIREALEKDAADPKSQILTEAMFLKFTNPDLANHLAADAAKDATISVLTGEISDLRKKLEQLSAQPEIPPAPAKPAKG